MDLVVIGCQPFLCYLQFLVYKQMDQQEKQAVALQNLRHYFHFIKFEQTVGHMETAVTVYAHLCELKNRTDWAWKLYQQSINNNAAGILLIRLFTKHFL